MLTPLLFKLQLTSLLSFNPALSLFQDDDLTRVYYEGPNMVLLWSLVGVGLIIAIVAIAGMWKTFEKAGEPGWAAIVPIYNYIVLMKIAGKPLWWILLMFIPLVNLVIAIMVLVAVAENFGKGAGFGVGLAFLGFIFFPILGFGDARYLRGPNREIAGLGL